MKIIVTLYFLFLTGEAWAQKIEKEKILHIIHAETDSLNLKTWQSCSVDSSFFQSDTIVFFYALNNSADLYCKKVMRWTFFDSTTLFQEYRLPTSAVPAIKPADEYNYKLSFTDTGSKISLYKNDMLFQRYKIIYIDKTVLLTGKSKCRSIGLVKID